MKPEIAKPLPREHGAWGLLLQPFLAGAILSQQWSWLLLPALGLTLFGFLLREPLTVLARQQFVWRDRNPQSAVAARWLAVEAAGAALCLAILLQNLPVTWLSALAAAAISLTVLAVWLTIRNRQRSIPLQIVSAAGLGSTALLAILAARGTVPAWSWQLYGILAAHGAASILAVHARLDGRIRLRQGRAAQLSPKTFAAPALLIIAAALAGPPLAIPLAFSALANAFELTRLRLRPEAFNEPLTRVGFRALGVSITHSILAIVSLWPLAKG